MVQETGQNIPKDSGRGATFAFAMQTDIGGRRKNNEDALICVPEHGVFCVADGMGGMDAGEVASGAVVDHIRQAFAASGLGPSATVRERAKVAANALKDAGRWIWKHSQEQGMRSCGTTAVALVLDAAHSGRATTLHAGDSRAYRYRKGCMVRITNDHSFAAATGVEDERLLPGRLQSVITRAVGIAEKVDLEETPVDVAGGDIFLLCSDGLTRMAPDADIRAILAANELDPPEKLAELLVARANRAGGLDNISVIVVRINESALAAAAGGESPTVAGDSTKTAADSDVTFTSAGLPDAGADSDAVKTSEATAGGMPPFVPLYVTPRLPPGIRLSLGVAAILAIVLLLLVIEECGSGRLRIGRESGGASLPEIEELPEIVSEQAAEPAVSEPEPESEAKTEGRNVGEEDVAPGSTWDGGGDE